MSEELSKGFTGIEVNGVKFSNIKEMLIYMNVQRDCIIKLDQQIEKMKCCGNCKYSNQESAYSIVCKVGGVDKTDYINIDDNQVCDKWEIKE